MILTVLIWSYITVIVLSLGFGTVIFLNRRLCLKKQSLSFIWMSGLCFVTVYAEYFSLFHKVGAAANAMLLIVVVFILVLEKKHIILYVEKLWRMQGEENRKKVVMVLLNTIIVLLFVCIGSLRAIHADTDLYHSQAIRWIEEYGVIKGLGNLYNRLAYNSAFMCLQALFSGEFLLNQSTHVVNSYIACGMFLHSFNTLFFYRKSSIIRSSDLFKVVALIYICTSNSLSALSSPNTDNFALLMVLFIFIKWSELSEDGEKDEAVYGMLCLLGVFACSLKLSTIMVLVLVLNPVVCLIKQRQWNKIIIFICSSMFIIAPFLIRNVLISGYLLYPYSQLDFFNVDWKMAKSVVDFDNKEIMAFGKGLNSYFLSDYSLKEWFPIWWSAQKSWLRLLVVVNCLIIPVYILENIIKIVKFQQKIKNYNEVFSFLAASIAFFFWFLSAPLARYGMIFAFEVPCILLGKWTGKSRTALFRYIGVGLSVLCVASLGSYVLDNLETISIKRSSYYIFRDCKEVEWEGIIMYVAKEDNYCGYYYIPATPYEEPLQYIELRGEDIEDGFRVKEEAKKIRFNNSGLIY